MMSSIASRIGASLNNLCDLLPRDFPGDKATLTCVFFVEPGRPIGTGPNASLILADQLIADKLSIACDQHDR